MTAITFEFHSSATASIEALASDAFLHVREIEIARKESKGSDWWQPDNPITITDDDIVGEPVMWLSQSSGDDALIFMWHDSRSFGLTRSDYEKLAKLIDAVLKVKWAQKSVSRKFVEGVFIDWARRRLQAREHSPFCNFFLDRCAKEVIPLTATVPIQHLAVEEMFEFGPTKISPMGPKFFDDLKEDLLQITPEKQEDVSALVARLRQKMENCSAIELQIVSEPGYAQDSALQKAVDAVGLLRFFSLSTVASTMMSPVTPLGALSVPKSHVLTRGADGAFQYTSRVAIDNVEYWRISKRDIAGFRQENLAVVGSLLDLEKLSDFERATRSSILAFARAITFPELSDRLVFAFSAIEGLMLRSASEPIQQNVAERVAFLISNTPDKRQKIVENFKKSYKMRSQYIHHRLTEVDEIELNQVFFNIRTALAQAVANLERFKTRDDFLAAIDRTKFGA
ncbi:HEPN domain-containing protein [Mesorhizobium sp.]|uniref:HEPN domain-containing protein n=1 Tax=Mesorhizobium sp. TaxID=1871066 RepID=UPI000FE975F4|nr:HEPN domain-containing protein [Mesorhizobium sp.]RWB22719.1 MAG: hypothetical protein EOQ40_05765 [Mesorhizobium sp.]TIS51996.1 MAG: hypothetical protein E5W96_01525 [Mesorhizobium sp.]